MLAVNVNNMHMFDPMELKWSEITQTNLLGLPPTPRHGCGFASVNGAIYVFGGKDEQRKLHIILLFHEINFFI
jgi:hypothetical protein